MTDPNNPQQPAGGAPVPPQQPPAGGYGQPPQDPYPGQAPVAPAAPAAPLSPEDQRLWATIAHAGGILFAIICPLVVWLVHKGRGQFVENQAKEALNFQITAGVAIFALYIFGFIVTFIFFPLSVLVWLLAGLVSLGALIFTIIAALGANKGENYRYPFAVRLVK